MSGSARTQTMMRGRRPARGTSRARLAALAAGTLAVCALLAPQAAQALTPPSVSTGAATQVSFGSAALGGSVNPKGSETYYYFQYGPTKALGLQTGILGAGAGTRTLHVIVAVSGLQPLTLYHYRLVAVNGAGAAVGAEKAFLTKKVPLSLQMFVSPRPAVYGGSVTIQGTLSGTGNGNREVVLQATAFPFATGFTSIGNPELTDAAGGFTFHVLGLTQLTQFRVVTASKPPVISPDGVEPVVPRVSAHARRLHARAVKGRRLVRFSGTVSPALEGMQVAIMRLVHGRNVLVSGTILKHGTAQTSRFDRVVRVRRGVFRILVRVTNGALSSTYSAPLLVR